MDTNLVYMSHFRKAPISEALIVGGMALVARGFV
jgi:hypothetical protein